MQELRDGKEKPQATELFPEYKKDSQRSIVRKPNKPIKNGQKN